MRSRGEESEWNVTLDGGVGNLAVAHFRWCSGGEETGEERTTMDRDEWREAAASRAEEEFGENGGGSTRVGLAE